MYSFFKWSLNGFLTEVSRSLVRPSGITTEFVQTQAMATTTLWPSITYWIVRPHTDFWDVRVWTMNRWPFLNWWNTLHYLRHQAIHLLLPSAEKNKHNKTKTLSFSLFLPIALVVPASGSFPLPYFLNSGISSLCYTQVAPH